MVVNDGILDCQSRLFIGPWAHNYNDEEGSLLEQNGGTVNISGMFGPGFMAADLQSSGRANATMIYVAMFDEIDEGTCIFKCTNDSPIGASPFLTYDQGNGEQPDHYLWLVGQASKMVAGETIPTETMPVR